MQKLSPSKGMVIILSAPSGGGKSSIARALLQQDSKLVLSVSVTTRSPRPGEVDGGDYYFTSEETFNSMVDKGDFLEFATIYGNLYGTKKQFVEDRLSEGYDVLFDIDYQGARQIMDQMPGQTLSIFINPPSIQILFERLNSRRQDDQKTIDLRMKMAKKEMEDAKHYDHMVINDKFDDAVGEIMSIIRSARGRRTKKGVYGKEFSKRQ